MRERDPYRRALRLEERLAETLTVIYSAVAVSTGGEGIRAFIQGASESGTRLVGGGIIAGVIAGGLELKRRQTKRIRLANAARERSHQ